VAKVNGSRNPTHDQPEASVRPRQDAIAARLNLCDRGGCMPSVSTAGTVPGLIGRRGAIDGIALNGPVLVAPFPSLVSLLPQLRLPARQSLCLGWNRLRPCSINPQTAQQPGHALISMPTTTS
jgi:hypothetical protein